MSVHLRINGHLTAKLTVLSGYGRSGLAVDLVGEDAQRERLLDSLIEARQQLHEALTSTTNQHGVGAVFIGSGGDATDRAQHANGDLTVLDQVCDVRKRPSRRGALRLGFLP